MRLVASSISWAVDIDDASTAPLDPAKGFPAIPFDLSIIIAYICQQRHGIAV